MYKFEQILPLIKDSLTEECCRTRVGEGSSLVIEFGKKIYHNKVNRQDYFVGEWSFGTNNRSWRIIKNNEMILGGESRFNNSPDTDSILQEIYFGRLEDVLFRNNTDLILKLDNEISIEYLACCHNEENFHIFLPKHRVLVFYANAVWVYGKSDIPWPNYLDIEF